MGAGTDGQVRWDSWVTVPQIRVFFVNCPLGLPRPRFLSLLLFFNAHSQQGGYILSRNGCRHHGNVSLGAIKSRKHISLSHLLDSLDSPAFSFVVMASCVFAACVVCFCFSLLICFDALFLTFQVCHMFASSSSSSSYLLIDQQASRHRDRSFWAMSRHDVKL